MSDVWIARMVQFGSALILIFALLNVIEFHGPRWSWALACAEFNVLLSISCLSLTFTRWFARNWRPVTFFLLTALIASNTALGTVGQQPMLLFLSLILLMAGTGLILPWSPQDQVVFSLVCLASWAIKSFWSPSLDGEEPYRIACLMTAAVLSWFSCYARNRFARENQESERLSKESESALRKIFDANTDGITLIDFATRRIQDVNEQFVRLSGYGRDEVVGKTTAELNVWADPAIGKEFAGRIRDGHSIRNMEVNFRTKDGRIIPCLLSSVVVVIRGTPCVMTLARDVSDLRFSQAKLRESEEKFRLIFESSRDAIMVNRASDATISDVNSHFTEFSGFTRAEALGRTALELGMWAVPEERAAFAKILTERGYVDSLEVSLRTRAGQEVPVLMSAVAVKLAGEDSYLSMTRDISHLRKAEQKLRRSEETFRKLFDSSIDSMCIVDMTSAQYVDVNPEFLRASGFSRDEIIGKTGDSLDQWTNAEQRQQFERALTETGEVRNMETDGRRKDGSVLTSLTSGVITEIAGRLCYLGVTRDISELKAAEQKLRKSEAMLRAIFANSPDCIWLLDLTTQTLAEVNSELSRAIGYSREEMIGKRFDALVPSADPVRQEQLMALLMQHREVRNFEIACATRSGRSFPTLLSAAVVMIDGHPYALCVARDITDLVAAREAALAASKAKSEFLSIMSHEIRTPMNAILGMADLIGESDLNTEQRRYLDTVLNNGNALLELIDGILDLAKVESGRLSLESVEFDVIELVERVADTLALRAHEKRVELAVRFEPGLPSMLTGDPHRLGQILINLIGNAIKFTKQGEVVVEVRRNPESARPGNLLFMVRDTGIGIPPDKIEKVFSIFTQADTSTTRKFGGSGLGLAIVQRLVALMGGRVWIESEVGKGSSFFFTANLPLPQASGAEVRPPIDPELRGVRTLLVIDHATARTIVAELLQAQGARVTEACSEAEALAALAAANREGTRFGFLVIDGDMKSNDIYETLRRIRGIEPDAPVVLLKNSNGLPARLRRMREHGLQHYCIKPVKRHELYRVIAEARAKSAAPRILPQPPGDASAGDGAPVAVAGRPLKILLADDSPDNRLLIRAYTKKTAYLLTEAENGQIAVERFIDGSYDLVLMDIQMPVLDGYSAVRAIRKWEREHGRARTPILALTASALEEDVRRAKAAGCDMHVSKPVKKSTLLDSIARAIEAAGKAAPIDKIDANGGTHIALVTANAASTDRAAFNSEFET